MARRWRHDSAGPMTFGMELILDLGGCAPEGISDAEAIRGYARELVKLIEMKPFGEPIIEHFGHDDPVTSGYTLVQLIETSSIVGHFSEKLGRAYLNIFSCRRFDSELALRFSADWFGSDEIRQTLIIR
ncbi:MULTISPECIES: S-adenosylmethionine decarboxylase family protein [Nocardia]|uniref:S-adenosylmethionine decarboxylase n=2 Tax=Nocardia nova TaxID=37330 RepID=A0A2S6A9P1_9NOCA|nr:S-adenosylmethionine decarboxylase [Nocardia nova]PPJ10080.1 S-adenosylmethionine decarboxylase [Nocardia nova]PPJ29939.1 S-adenosylmethionine decarboxylase [Nocardia nova]